MRNQSLIKVLSVGFFLLTLFLLAAFNFYPGIFALIPIESVGTYHQRALPHHISAGLPRINIHALLGLLLLVLGYIQFNDRLRASKPNVHRGIGISYLVTGLACIAIALALVDDMYASSYVEYAVYTLSVIWVWTAVMGLVRLYQNDFSAHRRWMTRNYFATLSTVFVRPIVIVELALFPAKPIEVVFSNAFWMTLIITILLCEWYITGVNRTPRQRVRN